MPKNKLDHCSSRSRICLICRHNIFKNGCILNNNATLTNVIRAKYSLLNNYDPSDLTYPNAICSTCCRAMYKFNNTEGSLPLIKACAYTTLDPTMHTRSCSDDASACIICLTARQHYKPTNCEPFHCSTCININDLPAKQTIQQPIITKNKFPKLEKNYQFTHTDLLNIQTQQNSSNNQIIKLAKSIRLIHGRSAVESGFEDNLSVTSKKAENFYSVRIVSLEIGGKVGGYEERVVSYCNDIEALIMHVLDARGMTLIIIL